LTTRAKDARNIRRHSDGRGKPCVARTGAAIRISDRRHKNNFFLTASERVSSVVRRSRRVKNTKTNRRRGAERRRIDVGNTNWRQQYRRPNPSVKWPPPRHRAIITGPWPTVDRDERWTGRRRVNAREHKGHCEDETGGEKRAFATRQYRVRVLCYRAFNCYRIEDGKYVL